MHFKEKMHISFSTFYDSIKDIITGYELNLLLL